MVTRRLERVVEITVLIKYCPNLEQALQKIKEVFEFEKWVESNQATNLSELE